MNVQEFASRTGISPHTVRYYEKIGLLPDIRRTASGHRDFSDSDILWMAFITRLKNTGMALADILAYATLRSQGATTLTARQQMLDVHAQRLASQIQTQQEHYTQLQEKIRWYHDEIIATTNISKKK
ncbi:MerR family transcriptional regulator [Undibacterium sp. RuTC16W]|uniref:MerR family transcriptional regulator n=1 Tax=Undibacterium sp. RuTC16W TaxID=3413048 RepID=UPI003BF14293